MIKFQWSRIALSGLVFTVITSVIRQAEVFLTMDYYTLPQYFGAWSKNLMPTAGPPPTSFILMSLAFTLATGLILAGFYNFVKDGITGGYWKKVIRFTLIMFILSIALFALPVFLLINLPAGLQAWWLVTSLIILFANSLVFAKLIK